MLQTGFRWGGTLGTSQGISGDEVVHMGEGSSSDSLILFPSHETLKKSIQNLELCKERNHYPLQLHFEEL